MTVQYSKAIVTLKSIDGVAENDVVNTFHFKAGAPADEGQAATALSGALTTFYQAIDASLIVVQVGAPTNYSLYNLEDTEPRVPYSTGTITLAGQPSTSLPRESSICLSYHAAPGSGLNPKRRRGRIYIGPIPAGALAYSVNDMKVTSTAMTTLANAANILAGPIIDAGSVEHQWAVFSPTSLAAGGSLAASMNNITGGYVDNAVDIQRRRGTASTSRTTWVA